MFYQELQQIINYFAAPVAYFKCFAAECHGFGSCVFYSMIFFWLLKDRHDRKDLRTTVLSNAMAIKATIRVCQH